MEELKKVDLIVVGNIEFVKETTNKVTFKVKFDDEDEIRTVTRNYNSPKSEYWCNTIYSGVKIYFDVFGTVHDYERVWNTKRKVDKRKTGGVRTELEVIEKKEEEPKREWKKPEGEVHHEKYDQIKTCLEAGIPVYLAGPAGSGKNHTVEQIAKELGWDFYFSNSVQQEYKLTGFIDAGGNFHETEFYKACTSENESVFFLDEMDASIPDVLVLLNAAIANGYFEFPNGRVDFNHVHFVAAGNTVGNGANDLYTGRMVLDQATLDRFAIIEFDYSQTIEEALTKGNFELIDFIHDLRKQSAEKGIRTTFSYRCMMMVTKLEKANMDLKEIMIIAIFKGLDKDTINTFTADTTNKYGKALRKVQVAA